MTKMVMSLVLSSRQTLLDLAWRFEPAGASTLPPLCYPATDKAAPVRPDYTRQEVQEVANVFRASGGSLLPYQIYGPKVYDSE